MSTFSRFLIDYDKKQFGFNSLKFNSVKYRQGARITCPFGLAPGYRKVEGEYIWDSVRIHTGVDRSGLYNSKEERIPNVIYSPFDFDEAVMTDYGEKHVYGSLLRLFNYEYGFEFRIIHLNPKTDITQSFKPYLNTKKKIPRNMKIGVSGTYGSASDGKHTHTELISLNKTNYIFDKILLKKYGMASTKKYTSKYIQKYYRKAPFFENATIDTINKEYKHLLESRRVNGIVNDYKLEYNDWFLKKNVTRYSTEKVFNGL